MGKKNLTIKSNETKITIGLILALCGLAFIVAPFFEELIFTFLMKKFGYASMIWGVTIFYYSLRFLLKNDKFKSNKFLIGVVLFAINTTVFLTFWIPEDSMVQTVIKPDFSQYGGEMGYYLHTTLYNFLGRFLEFILLFVMYIVSFSLITNVKLTQIRDFIVNFFQGIGDFGKKIKEARQDRKEKKQKKMKVEEAVIRDNSGANEPDPESEEEILLGGEEVEVRNPEVEELTEQNSQQDNSSEIEDEPSFDPGSDDTTDDATDDTTDDTEEEKKFQEPEFTDWEYPRLALLSEVVKQPQNNEVLNEKTKVIEKTLESFKIKAKVKEIVIGPTVVQFALRIMVGTKVSKIRNLTNDLALALATSASAIRIEAPIPGTSLVGIEIPNPTPNFVFLKEMVSQLQPSRDEYELPLILGKSVSGEFIIRDLTKLPHLLVAGATGTGKSVGINSMLMGLLMTKTPDEVKLILVDPKMVEMSPYNGVPSLLTPVITDMELVANALQWAVEEMHRRYRMLKSANVRNIAEFNKKLGFTGLPYIVIVIDEMADLMLSTGVDVESKIVRLAQMSRAVGIHLILATQRPSVNVITGLIKANVPGRVSYSVATAVDSRVIIDQSGADTLIGKGDLLFKSPRESRPLRIQGAYTDIKDIDSVVGFIKDQAGKNIEYEEEILETNAESSGVGNAPADEERDEYFEDALQLIIDADKGSASYLQRKLRVGYNRAARILDQLHEAGAVGPARGSKAREVTVNSVDDVLENDSTED